MSKKTKETEYIPEKRAAGITILCIIVDAVLLSLVGYFMWWLEDFLEITLVLALVIVSVAATWLTCTVVGIIRQWQEVVDSVEFCEDEEAGE